MGTLSNLPTPERSNNIINYYGVMNEKCDNKETVRNVVKRLHQGFIATGIQDCVFLEGNQVTYTSKKEEYGNDLKWQLPAHFKKFPGCTSKNLF